MQLTKHAHATVEIEDAGERVLIDPGTITPNAAELLARATAALITHDHFDHFAVDAVAAALDERPELRLWGPASVVQQLADTAAAVEGRVIAVAPGEEFLIGELEVRATGGEHALIHTAIPRPENVGYLIGGKVLHPGDSYAVREFEVDTLLVPVSGPWVKLGDAIEFITAVAPRQSVLIHDALLSELGRSFAAGLLGEGGPAGIPTFAPAAGEQITL